MKKFIQRVLYSLLLALVPTGFFIILDIISFQEEFDPEMNLDAYLIVFSASALLSLCAIYLMKRKRS